MFVLNTNNKHQDEKDEGNGKILKEEIWKSNLKFNFWNFVDEKFLQILNCWVKVLGTCEFNFVNFMKMDLKII